MKELRRIDSGSNQMVCHRVGLEKNSFSSLLPLTILFNLAIPMCDRILLYSLLVDTKELIIGIREALSGEVAHAC